MAKMSDRLSTAMGAAAAVLIALALFLIPGTAQADDGSVTPYAAVWCWGCSNVKCKNALPFCKAWGSCPDAGQKPFCSSDCRCGEWTAGQCDCDYQT